jgi:hypothetical protein
MCGNAHIGEFRFELYIDHLMIYIGHLHRERTELSEIISAFVGAFRSRRTVKGESYSSVRQLTFFKFS